MSIQESRDQLLSVIDEYKLKGLLEALVGEPHYNAVIALVVANAAGTEEHTGSLLHAVGEALGMDLPGDPAVPNRRDDKRTMLKAVILRDSKPD